VTTVCWLPASCIIPGVVVAPTFVSQLLKATPLGKVVSMVAVTGLSNLSPPPL
jgi:hypothetical protein